MRFVTPPPVEELYGQTDVHEEAGCDPGGEECDVVDHGGEDLTDELDDAVLGVFD